MPILIFEKLCHSKQEKSQAEINKSIKEYAERLEKSNDLRHERCKSCSRIFICEEQGIYEFCE